MMRGGSCLYLVAARFNHACGDVRSVDYRFSKGDIIELTMVKDVKAGVELTISYGAISPKTMYAMWGFRCGCGACKPLTDAEVARIDGAYDANELW